jgi:aspartate racemase
LDEILAAPRRCLLLATTGTRAARIFESHERWNQVERWVAFPNDEDQRELHKLLYRLKAGLSGEGCLSWIDTLAARYQVEGFLFGCTELHLLHRFLATRPPGAKGIIDPLWTAARDFRRILKI